VITDTTFFPGEAQVLNELFEAGMQRLHIRKPNGGDVRGLLDGIKPVYYEKIALHQQHHLAADYGIKRLHFPEHQRLVTNVVSWATEGYTLSTSVHNKQTAMQLPALFAYSFFGPVFNSISKEDYTAIVGEDFYWEEKSVPMIALGGIDASNIGHVAAMNFDGAAVLGALWKDRRKAVAVFKSLK
jgi:thiamine-phosphate pyrophosphorylase